jgi:uncharacterized membrane protein YeaQ/YmgE (transglycosylase-associated protein family)
MYLLAWIFIGAVVGWGAGRGFQGEGYGPFMDILMGAGGGVAGGLLMRSSGYGGTVVTSLFAVIGAVLLTILFGVMNGRKIFARQS